jgi:hypothetical protein
MSEQPGASEKSDSADKAAGVLGVREVATTVDVAGEGTWGPRSRKVLSLQR